MLLLNILLVARVLLDPAFTGESVGQTQSGNICTSNEIFERKVSGCTCRDASVGGVCNSQCTVSSLGCPAELSGIYLSTCSNCTSPNNKDCDACGVWLHSFCQCLKNGCPKSASAGGNYWVQLESKDLATTSTSIDNIVLLQRNHPSLSAVGWTFGQTFSAGLAINPARTVTQDQVHMHICSVNTNARNVLSALHRDKFTSLTPVSVSLPPLGPTTIYCLVSKAPKTAIPGDIISGAITQVLNMQGICDYDVGAAVIMDNSGYTWACVTADKGDTQHRFLAC